MKRTLFYAIVFLKLISVSHLSAQESKVNRFSITPRVSVINLIQADLTVRAPAGGGMAIDLLTNNSYGVGLGVNTGFYIFPDRLFIGIASGLDFYNAPDMVLIPIFADLRFYWIKHIHSPYIYFEMGSALKLGSDFSSGRGGKIGMGYKFPVSKKLAMTFDIAIDGKSFDLPEDQDLLIRGTSFTLGVLF